VIGVVGAVVAWAKDVEIPFLSERLRRNSRSGYRTVRLDDAMDAELLGKLSLSSDAAPSSSLTELSRFVQVITTMNCSSNAVSSSEVKNNQAVQYSRIPLPLVYAITLAPHSVF